MTQPVSNNIYSVATGTVSTTAFNTVIATRNPTGNDLQYPIQKRWINSLNGIEYFLLNYTSTGGVVEANWLQISGGTTALNTLTANSGGPVSPIAGNINMEGDGTTINIIGNPATATLTANVVIPATAHVVLLGETSSIGSVTPSSTAGIPLVSNGSSIDPSFTTAVVAGGGTGNTSFTAYSVICGGSTSTANLQNVSTVGIAGQVLTSNGPSTLPTWQGPQATGGLVWSEETSSFNAMAGTGYFCEATLTATLPAGASRGTTISFRANTSGTVTIQGSGSDQISIGSATSSSGNITNNARGDAVRLIYLPSAATWEAEAVIGTWTVN